jgi:hypothetical protein
MALKIYIFDESYSTVLYSFRRKKTEKRTQRHCSGGFFSSGLRGEFTI